MTTTDTPPDTPTTVGRFHDYDALGWFPTDLGGQLVVPAGVWFDMAVMPATLAQRLLGELAIAMFPAAAIHDHTQDRAGVLIAPTSTHPVIPHDLAHAGLSLVPAGMPVPVPGPPSTRYRWLAPPNRNRQPPPWSTVVCVARRILSARP